MYIGWTGLAYSRTACFAQRLISDWTGMWHETRVEDIKQKVNKEIELLW